MITALPPVARIEEPRQHVAAERLERAHEGRLLRGHVESGIGRRVARNRDEDAQREPRLESRHAAHELDVADERAG
jgi:hypothetical protein